MFAVLLVFSTSGIKAQVRYFSELTDSARTAIRLTSYLMVSPSEYKPEIYKPLFEKQIPIVIDCRKKTLSTADLILKDCKKYKHILVLGDPAKIPATPTNPELIFIRPNDLDSITCRFQEDITNLNLPSPMLRELLLVHSQDSLPTFEQLIRLWQARGKMPNLLAVPAPHLDQFSETIDKLNHTRKIFGMVISEEGLLPKVLLKGYPKREISGHFSLPLTERVFLRPYKAGYHFSPDVFNDSPNNEKNMKIFRGSRYLPEFGLTDFFRFRNGVSNLYREANTEMVVENVQFVKDPERGKSALFHKAYIDAGVESRTVLGSAFSITVWIKPLKLENNNSILGKGTNFVLKLHQGKLTFTMAGIKDYFSESSVIPINQWTHVGMVFSQTERKIRFYMNGKQTDQIDLIADYVGSDHSLLIGSNLWDEYFSGYINDVKIWNRELNEKEISTDFLDAKKGSDAGWIKWALTLATLFVIVFLGLDYFNSKKKARLGKGSQTKMKDEKNNQNLAEAEKILCFGGLKIYTAEGIEISTKLSPKLKQLFVLILLHSGPDKKGISSKKMSELLWPGMNEANAKNIRGTNIQNLRQVLSACRGVGISFQDKLWSIELTGEVYCDYFLAAKLIGTLEEQATIDGTDSRLNDLTHILKQGSLLPNINQLWLDSYQEQFSNRVIEFCLGLFQKLTAPGDGNILLDLATIVSIYDELNEAALKMKIRVLSIQGKHSMAQSVYKNYTKLYHELYRSDYPVEFLDILSQ